MSELETDNLEDVIDDEIEMLDAEVHDDEPIVESAFDRPGEWYVVRCFSGHEKKVADALNTLVENQDLKNEIYEIVIPEEDVIEIRREKRVTTKKKTFPGYMLVRCRPTIMPAAISSTRTQRGSAVALRAPAVRGAAGSVTTLVLVGSWMVVI